MTNNIEIVVTVDNFSYFLQMSVTALSKKKLIAIQLKPRLDELLAFLGQKHGAYLIRTAEKVSTDVSSYILNFKH